MGGSNPLQMVQQIKNFGRNLKGDPKQIVMNMVQNGQITNPQLQQAMQMAKQIQRMIKQVATT
nr:MAG TPA: hypothetical protein [Caudoviricetes sp.]